MDAPQSPYPDEPAPPPSLLEVWWAAAKQKPVSFGLIAACVLFWGLTNLWGRDSDSILWYLGANQGRAVRAGDYYRLLSCVFLHLGAVHLLLNMVALRALSVLEPVLGRRRYLILYFCSGLGGSLSTALLRPDVFSVGASGAIWGLMGAAFGMRIPTRHVLRARGMRLSAGWQVLALNLGISFVPGVDLTAHLGGGIVGFVLGAVAIYPQYERAVVSPRRNLADKLYTLGSVLAVLAFAGALALALLDGRPWRFSQPPRMRRVALGTTPLSVELPEPIDREPLPIAQGKPDGFHFGIPGRSPIAVKIALDAVTEEELSPETHAEHWLSQVRAEIEREPTDPDLPRSSLEFTSLGGRRVLRDEYRGNDRRVVRYFEVVGRYPIVIAVARFEGWRSDLWPDVEARIAQSLAEGVRNQGSGVPD